MFDRPYKKGQFLSEIESPRILAHYLERKVEDAITNVFLMIQKDQGIRTGDCPPLLAYDLENKTDALIGSISDIIPFQMEHCK